MDSHRRTVVPSVQIWYAAHPDKAAAVEAVRKAVDSSSASVEIGRGLSEALMASLGLRTGEVKCFD